MLDDNFKLVKVIENKSCIYEVFVPIKPDADQEIEELYRKFAKILYERLRLRIV